MTKPNVVSTELYVLSRVKPMPYAILEEQP